MCFSATASFSVAAALVPVGAYCVHTARQLGPRWMPLAIYPLAFSVQQAIEGIVWLGVYSDDQAVVAIASRGFLFFSHFFWLFWVPYSVYKLEDALWRCRLLLGLVAIGSTFGLSVFLPLLLVADWLAVEQVHQSLEYKTVLLYDGIVGRGVLRGLYALVIVTALISALMWPLRLFGGIILISFLATAFFFSHAVISVWCFFAAISSTYLLGVLLSERQRVLNTP